MKTSKKLYFVTWLMIAAVISFVISFNYNLKSEEVISFWLRLLAAIVSIPVGFIGFVIGDFVRRIAIPDVIFTTGGMLSILKEKFFWFCIPQIVGIVIGILLASSMILPKNDPRQVRPSTSEAQQGLRFSANLTPFDLSVLMDAMSIVSDINIQRNISDITPIKYLNGSGVGALITTKAGAKYLTIQTVDPQRMTTCEVDG